MAPSYHTNVYASKNTLEMISADFLAGANLDSSQPLRLARPEYEELRPRVLRRDGWRCQFCGSMHNLEIHHQEFRRQVGAVVIHELCFRYKLLSREFNGSASELRDDVLHTRCGTAARSLSAFIAGREVR